MKNEIQKKFNQIKNILQILYNKIPFRLNTFYIAFLVFQCVAYLIFRKLTLIYSFYWWTPESQIDPFIPLFLPMVAIYVLYAPLMLTPVFFPMKKILEKRLVFSLVTATLCNYIISFTVSPTINSQPPLSNEKEGLLLDTLVWIYTNDPIGLYFPSIHVMHSLLIGFHLWKKDSYSRILLLAAIPIASSTVFVKQHFFFDLVAGVFFAIFIYYVVPYVARRVFKTQLD